MTPNVATPSTRRTRLEDIVRTLASEIGPRNIHHYDALERARGFIEDHSHSGYSVGHHGYDASGHVFTNVLAEKPGRSRDTIIVGAH
jgi:hypothetical protein